MRPWPGICWNESVRNCFWNGDLCSQCSFFSVSSHGSLVGASPAEEQSCFLFTEGAGATLGLGLVLAREQMEHGHWSMLGPVAVGYHCPAVGCALTCCGIPPPCCRVSSAPAASPTCCMMSPICCGMFPPSLLLADLLWDVHSQPWRELLDLQRDILILVTGCPPTSPGTIPSHVPWEILQPHRPEPWDVPQSCCGMLPSKRRSRRPDVGCPQHAVGFPVCPIPARPPRPSARSRAPGRGVCAQRPRPRRCRPGVTQPRLYNSGPAPSPAPSPAPLRRTAPAGSAGPGTGTGTGTGTAPCGGCAEPRRGCHRSCCSCC